MFKFCAKILIFIFTFFVFQTDVFSETLELQKNKLYLLNFEQNILNFYTDKTQLDSQLLNTIYTSNQLLLVLKSDEAILQVKTEDNFYKFEIKSGDNACDKNLFEIDYPVEDDLLIDLPHRLEKI